MKLNKIFSAILMAMLVLVSSFSFSACNEDDQLNTDQYREQVSLLVFGPCPVARGGQLRILGTGLDQVSSVSIPGSADITDIERVSREEIHVTVPQDAQPGQIVLHTSKGDITSVTRISYTEPVGFEGAVTPNPVKPGQTLTIKGEYLNLVQSVIFADKVESTEFTTHTRKEIVVAVPYEAQTGKIALSFCATGDTIPNEIYSDEVVNVILPAVDEVANLTGKKPGDKISQKGTNLDLVNVLTVAGESVAYLVNDGVIEYTLPETTPAQATVSVWPASGVECPIAYIGMMLPTELKATPATDVKAGDKIVITGKDLDVVYNVQFTGAAEASGIEDQSATSITVVVPADAQSGDITLNCKSGATATVAIVTAKPVAESYNPSPADAGEVVTIKGQNLELVSQITFTDNLVVTEFVSQSETELSVKVPATAVSGELAVAMKNGEQVTFQALEVNSPKFCFIPEMPNTAEVKAGDMVCATVVNADKLTGVQIDGQDCQYILIGEDQLYIGTPANGNPKSKLKLISSNGEIEYNLPLLPNSEIVTTLWSGASVLSWSSEGQIYLGTDGGPELTAANAKAGDILRIKFQPTADDWCIQIWEGHWSTQYDQIQPDNYDLAGNDYYYNIVLTDELLSTFTTAQGWGGIVLVQGQSTIVTALELFQKVSMETVLWKGEAVADDWGNQPTFFADGGAELLEAGMKVGSMIRFYITPMEENWNLQVWEGHWGGSYNDLNQGNYDLSEHNGAVELQVTQEIFDKATTPQGWGNAFLLNGDNVICTKVTIE